MRAASNVGYMLQHELHIGQAMGQAICILLILIHVAAFIYSKRGWAYAPPITAPAQTQG